MSEDSQAAGQFVKVVFELPREDDEWPPVAQEGLWAVPVTSEIVRVDNTPWFVLGVAYGDLIEVRRGEDGQWWAGERLHSSGHCTIRVVAIPDGPLEGSARLEFEAFAPLGVSGEYNDHYGIIALNVPPDVDHDAVKQLLDDGERDNWWEYEEGCINDAWFVAGKGTACGSQPGKSRHDSPDR